MSSVIPLVKRIRVKTFEDIDRLYPLILDFHKRPDRAASVTEFVFKRGIQPDGYFFSKTDFPDGWKAREAARRVAATSPLWNIVQRIGLSADEDTEWVKTLSWKDPEIISARQAAFNALGRPREVQSWFQHQDTVFARYAAAVLLTLCPNIESLVYEHDVYPSPVFDLLRRNNYGTLAQPYLSRLQSVLLLPESDGPYTDPRFYAELNVLRLMHLFHRLPSMQLVSADAIEPMGKADYDDSFPPASSKVKKIHMGHVSLPDDVMTALIRMPKRLEEFTCTTGGRATHDGGFSAVYPELVGKALWCQRSCLMKLDLDLDEPVTPRYEGYDEDSDIEDEDGWVDLPDDMVREPWETGAAPVKTADLDTGREYNSTIGSLHDFERLSHLSIGVELLLGPRSYKMGAPDTAPFRLVEALPRSLEHLTLRGYQRGEEAKYDEQIDELLALQAERLPKLRLIEGVNDLVRSGRNVDCPDQNEDELWEPETLDDDWAYQ